MKKKQETKTNSVNGATPSLGSPSLGRCPMVEQHRPGRQSATVQHQPSSKKEKRIKWSIDDNKEILLCYFKAEPKKLGYRKRLYKIWQERNNKPEISEQHLAGQTYILLNPEKVLHQTSIR